MFYDRFAILCQRKGITLSRGAQEAGISKSLVTKWKTKQTEVPSADVLSKLSAYFGVPVSELLGEEPDGRGFAEHPKIDRNDLKFALFRGRETVTDAMLEEVLSFAEYVAHREDAKNR